MILSTQIWPRRKLRFWGTCHVVRILSSRKQTKETLQLLLTKVITLKEWRKYYLILTNLKGRELNCLLEHEDKLVNFLKRVKKSLGEEVYKDLYPQGSQPGVLYGLSKIRKPLVNNIPKLRPILSALKQVRINGLRFLSLCYEILRLMNTL